jgi:hypothetical protein
MSGVACSNIIEVVLLVTSTTFLWHHLKRSSHLFVMINFLMFFDNFLNNCDIN